MKSLSKTAAAIGVALACAGTSFAATPTLHICGATTYRGPVHQAICDMLDPGTVTYVYDSGTGSNATNPYKQNAATYSGKLGGVSIIIETYFTGSASGVYDLIARNNITSFISPTNSVQTAATQIGASLAWQGGNSCPAGGVATYTGAAGTYGFDTATPPDFVLSDAFDTSVANSIATADIGGAAAQAIVKAGHANLLPAGTSGTGGTHAATAKTVGLVGFQWVLGKTTTQPVSLTSTPPTANITQNEAQSLLTTGYIPLMFLTGSVSDKHNYVILLGRNEDSGSRINALAESQQTFFFGQPVNQMQLSFTGTGLTSESDGVVTGGSTGTVAGFTQWPGNWPVNTETSFVWSAAGHSGYIGGGDLKNALSANNSLIALSTLDSGGVINDTSKNLGYFIGYLGSSDAAVSGGLALNYNGVPFSATAVGNGQYSLWGFEHAYILKPTAPGGLATGSTQLTLANTLADKIFNTDADVNGGNSTTNTVHGTSNGNIQSGIFFNSSVVVSKSAEGAVI
jgi:hypothetical protein